jgi:Ca-activated chloride channel family protein
MGVQKIAKGFDAQYGSASSGIVNCPSPSGQWLPHGGTTPPNGEPYSGTFFKHYGTNPFVDTEDDHLSTFAIDVDDASYSVMRGYIEKGHLPKPEAVRVEEFVNYFNYDYPAPQSERFKVYIEGAPSKFGQNCDIIRVGIKGQEVNPKHRKPAMLTFVIDVSGSMRIDSRLGMVKKALKILVDNLNEDDRVGIAVYASRGQKILDHTSVKDKDKILYAIESLRTSGSTYAEEGLKIGYKMASENFKKGAINRIILCSDGVANVGRTGADEILREIKKYVEQGITLTTVGFGMDNYNDVLMEKLGDKGNGHFAYVDNLEQAKRIFMQNLTGTLQVIARDVKIQVDFDPQKVRSYRLLGYENRDVEDDKFRDDKEDGGEIGSGHDVTALYEVKFKDGARGKFATVYMRYKDPDFVDEVTEVNYSISRNDLRAEFSETNNSFKLAVCAAEFAEILRESFYARDANFTDLLDLAQELSGEMKGNDDVIEFTALISRAKKLWDEKELLSSED